jgi:hypothetical protein
MLNFSQKPVIFFSIKVEYFSRFLFGFSNRFLFNCVITGSDRTLRGGFDD